MHLGMDVTLKALLFGQFFKKTYRCSLKHAEGKVCEVSHAALLPPCGD